MSTIYEYKLIKPVKSGNDVITNVELREINAGDIQECGDIFDFMTSGLVRANNQAVAAYISALSGMPPSVVKQLSAEDFYILKGAIASFFAKPSPQTSLT